MKNLFTIRDSDIFPEVDNKDPHDFYVRRAARAVLTNELGNVALLLVGRHNYHKLPGGGVKEGEDLKEALWREIAEEIGARALIAGNLGEIVEHRNEAQMTQLSYCFRAYQQGETFPPDFTQSERDDEFSVEWAADLDDAITTLEQDQPDDYDGQFAHVRDLAFLREAKAKSTAEQGSEI